MTLTNIQRRATSTVFLFAMCNFAHAAISVEPSVLNVGVLASGGSRTIHVTVGNTGQAPLKILAVEVECKTCTHVVFSPVTLAPGKSLDVPVTFAPPADDVGRIRRSITIATDDPKQPSLRIPLNAYVTATAGLWPNELAVDTPQAPGSDVELAVELINVSNVPLTPLYATGPVDGPKLTVPHDPVPAGGKVRLLAKWHLPAKPGRATGQLILYVDHPQLTMLTIPYDALVAAAALPPSTPRASPASKPAASAGSSAPVQRVPTTTGAASASDLGRSGAMGVVAPPSEASATVMPPPPPMQMINLDLKDSLPLKDFVDIVATQLKLNLIYDDAAMTTPVSIRLSGPLPADALLPLLKTLLQAKGLALVATDRPEFFRIVTSREAQNLVEPGKPAGAEGSAQIVTEFLTPSSVDVETAAGLLRGFLTPNAGQITTIPRIKTLIVTDYSSQLVRLHRLLDLVDKPQAAASVAVIPLKAAEAGPLADRITKLLTQVAKAEGRASFDNVFLSASEEGSLVVVGPDADLPRVTALVKQFDTAPSLIRVDYPINEQQRGPVLDTIRQALGTPGSNASPTPDGMPRIVTTPQRISVLATEGQHRRLKELLAGSVGADGEGVQLKAYRVQNRDAAELYATLTRLMGDNHGLALSLDSGAKSLASPLSTNGITRVGTLPNDVPKPTTSDAASAHPVLATAPASVNITVDQGTNTLLIAANAETHRRLAVLINELDRKQAQVLLEVMLVSVADSDTFAAAVEAAVKANLAGSTIGVGTDAGIGSGDFVKGRTPTVASGLNAAIFNPASFSVFLNALAQTNKARVLSVPRILALDNKPALLSSIQQEPFTSVNASTTVATTSFGGFAEAGTTLEMTPHIAPADYLNLEYRLEVSSFTGSSSGNGVPPPRRSDTVTSFVSVPDGSTVVLGGLQSSNTSTSVAKVPGLGDIPLLGWIGRNENNTKSTAAFYVFVRPTILRAAKFEDLKAMSQASKQAAKIKSEYPETVLHYLGN